MSATKEQDMNWNDAEEQPSPEDFAEAEWVLRVVRKAEGGVLALPFPAKAVAALSRVLEAAREAESHAEKLSQGYMDTIDGLRARVEHWQSVATLDQAAAHAELSVLRRCVEKLETALREIERRVPPDYGGTHYEGCEEHHDWCAVLKQARAALAHERSEK